jgi:exosortase
VLVGLGLTAVVVFVFWPTLAEMADRWANDSRYSHGYFVPLFAAYLLWSRRRMLDGADPKPSWWGLPVLAVGLLVRAAGTALYLDFLSAVALLPTLTGVVLLAGGRTALKWSWPAIAFLAFMVPLPFRVEVALAYPLQRIATLASTYALETLGFFVVAEGNTIRMGDVRLGVVEACNGLSMLVVFFALSTAMAIVVRRPWYDKLVLVASAIPIALAANIIRITVTGVLHKTAGSEIADLVFHDLAGWLMMPLALSMLWVEMKILAWVIQDVARPAPAAPTGSFGFQFPVPGSPPAPAAK